MKGTTIMIIAGIGALLLTIIVWVLGIKGLFQILMYFVAGAIILGAFFLVIFLAWYLFFRLQKYDVNYVNKQKLIKAGTMINTSTMKDLVLTGDKGHSLSTIGKITGYLRIQVLKRNYLYKVEKDQKTGREIKKPVMVKNDQGQLEETYELEKMEQDVFIVKTKGLFNMFSEPMVIRVDPRDHDELVGDVHLAGFSLINISEYWFLNSDHLDVRKIDSAILHEAERTIAFEVMSDMKEIVDNATGVDAKHKKAIEGKAMYEIPELQGSKKE